MGKCPGGATLPPLLRLSHLSSPTPPPPSPGGTVSWSLPACACLYPLPLSHNGLPRVSSKAGQSVGTSHPSRQCYRAKAHFPTGTTAKDHTKHSTLSKNRCLTGSGYNDIRLLLNRFLVNKLHPFLKPAKIKTRLGTDSPTGMQALLEAPLETAFLFVPQP